MIIIDHDGVDDASGETQFIDWGPIFEGGEEVLSQAAQELAVHALGGQTEARQLTMK